MRLSTILTITCLFTSFSLAACDEALDASDLELAAADEAAANELPALAAAPIDDADDADEADEADDASQFDGEMLGFSAAPNAVFGGPCSPGTTAIVNQTISACGTCKANIYYPGQWVKHYSYYCKSNGQWDDGTPAGTSCEHC